MKKPTDVTSGLTHEYLTSIIDYDGGDGLFRWKVKRRYGIGPGSPAGTTMSNGYKLIVIDGRSYLAHRLAWFFTHKGWPSGCIDHINGDVSDNRIINLRDATVPQNHFNMKRPTNNTSGRKGVWFDKRRNRWNAELVSEGKKIFLGSSPELTKATEMRVAGERKFYGEYARTF